MKPTLSSSVRRWGTVQLLVVLCLVPFSYGLARLYPDNEAMLREEKVFASMAASLSWLPEPAAGAARDWLSGVTLAASPRTVQAFYALALITGPLCLLMVLRALARARPIEQERAERAITAWALLFGAASLLIYPVFTQDMWLSMAWGRMCLTGSNPYYEPVSEIALQGLPLDPHQSRMTYGPLWALVSAALAGLARGNGLAEFALMKVTLFALWAGCLALVGRMARGPGGSAAMSICLFGWLPLSFAMPLGEGHNDVALLAPLLLWGYLALRGHHRAAPFALVASVLMKYVTIVLVPIEIWRACRSGQARRPGYWVALGMALLLSAGVVGLFAKDLHFLDDTLAMRNWNFLQPRGAVFQAATLVGLPASEAAAALVVIVLCTLVVGRRALYFHRAPTHAALLDLSITALAILLFSATGHVWPWFLVWTLGFCALRPEASLSRYLLVLALFTPFLHLFNLQGAGWKGIEWVTLAVYGLAIPQTIALGILMKPVAGASRMPP